jgi:hypothetical protein
MAVLLRGPRGLFGVLVPVLLLAGVLAFGSVSSGQTAMDNRLTLVMQDGATEFRWNGLVQTFTSVECEVVLASTGPQLVTLGGAKTGDPNGGLPGFFENELGVTGVSEKNTGSTGRPCGEVDSSERLVIGPGSFLQGAVGDQMSLVLTRRSGQAFDARIEAFRNGVSVYSQPHRLNNLSNRIDITLTGGKVFDRIEITSTSSNRSLSLASGSWIELSDPDYAGFATCDEGVATLEPTVTGDAADVTSSVNSDDADCIIFFDLEVATDTRTILFDYRAPAGKTGVLTFDFTFEWAVEDTVYPIPHTTINFTPGTGSGQPPKVCAFDAEGEPVAPAATSAEPWCIGEFTVVSEGGKTSVTERYLGSGDPSWAR